MNVCQQICLPVPGRLFSCACATGFKLNPDNRTCSPYTSFIVVSSLRTIRGFSLQLSDHSEAMVPVAGPGTFLKHKYHLTPSDAVSKSLVPYSISPCLDSAHDLDNHSGVIAHLEPDILECEVKWALESITTDKASGCDGIPVELLQFLEGNMFILLDNHIHMCSWLISAFLCLKSHLSYHLVNILYSQQVFHPALHFEKYQMHKS